MCVSLYMNMCMCIYYIYIYRYIRVYVYLFLLFDGYILEKNLAKPRFINAIIQFCSVTLKS